MRIEIVQHDQQFVTRVKEFNQRLSERGVPFQFPESPIPGWLPRLEGRQTYIEYFLALENGDVRGGYVLKRQPFWIAGQDRPIGSVSLPLAEGVINKAYGTVGVYLLADAVRRQPLQYSLGMGGTDNPLVKILQAMAYDIRLVPFYFRVIRPRQFLRQVRYLRTSTFKRRLLDVLAASGVGWAAIRLAQAGRRAPHRRSLRADVEVLSEFPDWCAQLWDACKHEYTMIGLRDTATLNILYPRDDPRFRRLQVSRGGAVLGWVVALATQMARHKQLGDMKVGSIIDCLGLARDAKLIIRAATAYLEQLGVDIIVSNQSADVWRQAFLSAGYLRGSSNFALATSKPLAQLLGPFEQRLRRIHITRGDGEGPTNL